LIYPKLIFADFWRIFAYFSHRISAEKIKNPYFHVFKLQIAIFYIENHFELFFGVKYWNLELKNVKIRIFKFFC